MLHADGTRHGAARALGSTLPHVRVARCPAGLSPAAARAARTAPPQLLARTEALPAALYRPRQRREPPGGAGAAAAAVEAAAAAEAAAVRVEMVRC